MNPLLASWLPLADPEASFLVPDLMRPSRPICLFITLLLGCGGGGGGSSPASGGGGGNPPPVTTCPLPTPIAAPTFNRDILSALTGDSCGTSQTNGCHGGNSIPSGHINFFPTNGRSASDVYADLVNKVPASAPPGYFLISPRDPSHSWLLVKITTDNPFGYGTRMPQIGANICPATVDNITAWINAGAPF